MFSGSAPPSVDCLYIVAAIVRVDSLCFSEGHSLIWFCDHAQVVIRFDSCR